jgi:hypothetical protein
LQLVNLNFLHIANKSRIYLHIAGISHSYNKESSLLVVTVDMGKSGHVNRKEPEGPEIMEAYENNRHIFDQAGWYMFCAKLDGYHYGVARAFAEGFDGQRVGLLI